MPTHKLTKVYLESIAPTDRDVEIRDTVVPGFLCKLTPSGRRVFMLSYRTLAGQRRKPALGTWGELTVEQARDLARERHHPRGLRAAGLHGAAGGAGAETAGAPDEVSRCLRAPQPVAGGGDAGGAGEAHGAGPADPGGAAPGDSLSPAAQAGIRD